MDGAIVLLTVVISFLCGSIPTGYLIIKKLYGIDIRTKGSGNIGSTNVKRIAGVKASMVTQAIDILKGVIPIILGMCLAKYIELPVALNIYFSIIAISVIMGHDYTPFLKFNGGKGANTTIGAFILIAPIPTITGFAVYLVLRLCTRLVSIRSLIGGITIPIMCVILNFPMSIVTAAIVAWILMVVRHKDNLIRIVHKEEK